MNFFTFSVLATIFLASSSRVLSQERFAVTIHHFVQPNLTERVFACGGTIISDRHALTTARCVDVDDPLEIAVELSVSRFIVDGDVNSTFTSWAPRSNIVLHPNYIRGQIGSTNIAVVSGFLILTSIETVVPRTLGSLSSFGNCQLFGWDTAVDLPRNDTLPVTTSVLCRTDAPHCSLVTSPAHPSCTAMEASPLVCNDGAVDGILADEGCTQSGSWGMLSFYSVGPHIEWIDVAIGRANATAAPPTIPTTEPTTTAGAETTAVSSLLALVAAINLIRVIF